MRSVKLVFVLLFAYISFGASHPFHASITQCNFNKPEELLEITIRVFTEDLSLALGEEVLINEKEKETDPKALDKQGVKIEDYVRKNFSLKANGKELSYEAIGHEAEFDLTYIYFEIPAFKIQPSYEISQTLFFDLFEDQSNIVNLIIEDETYSDYFTTTSTIKTYEIE